MRRHVPFEFVYQIFALVLAAILVHAAYLALIRPRATAVLEAQQLAVQADPQYVNEPSVWVILKDYEQELGVILTLWGLAIMGWKFRNLGRERALFDASLVAIAEGESILRITTEPTDARVRFDGEWHDGGSPYEFRVPTRNYPITVSRSGHRSDERTVELTSGEATEITVELRERRGGGGRSRGSQEVAAPTSNEPGRLTFNSNPWCNVTIDGRNAGQTPVVNFQLPPGRHTVVCTNPEAGSRRVSIDIPPGQTVRRAITLQ